MSANNIFIVDWLSSYNLYGVPIGYPIDLQENTIQFLSNTPVSIIYEL